MKNCAHHVERIGLGFALLALALAGAGCRSQGLAPYASGAPLPLQLNPGFDLDRECSLAPTLAVIDHDEALPGSGHARQVTWTFKNPQAGDRIEISPKDPKIQDPRDPAGRGKAIHDAFSGNTITLDSQIWLRGSGKLKHKLKDLPVDARGEVHFFYEIVVYQTDGPQPHCRIDPEICIRTKGNPCGLYR